MRKILGIILLCLLAITAQAYTPAPTATSPITISPSLVYGCALCVVGPSSSTNGNLASYNGTTGKLIQDSGIAASTLTGGPFLKLSGGTMSGNINMAGHQITGNFGQYLQLDGGDGSATLYGNYALNLNGASQVNINGSTNLNSDTQFNGTNYIQGTTYFGSGNQTYFDNQGNIWDGVDGYVWATPSNGVFYQGGETGPYGIPSIATFNNYLIGSTGNITVAWDDGGAGNELNMGSYGVNNISLVSNNYGINFYGNTGVVFGDNNGNSIGWGGGNASFYSNNADVYLQSEQNIWIHPEWGFNIYDWNDNHSYFYINGVSPNIGSGNAGTIGIGNVVNPQYQVDINDYSGTGYDIGNSTTGHWNISNLGDIAANSFSTPSYGKIFSAYGGGAWSLNLHGGTNVNLSIQDGSAVSGGLGSGVAFSSVNDAATANEPMQFRSGGGLQLSDWSSGALSITGYTNTSLDTSGNLTTASFKKTGGTSSQFLKADGSTDSSTYLSTKGIGTATLVSGTKAITISGLTSSNQAFVQLVTPAGTLGAAYKAVCSTNTLTITSVSVAGVTVTTDTSTLNYIVH